MKLHDILRILTAIIFITFLGRFGFLVNAESNSDKSAVILKSVSNIYSEPDQNSEILTQAVMGEEVKILEGRKTWIKVSIQDGYTGWTEAGSVKIFRAAGNVKQWALVKVRTAALRKEPSEISSVKTTVVLGTKLEVLQKKGSWLNLSLAGEPVGWLNSSDAEMIESGKSGKKISSDDILATAKKFLGTPYLWGGVTTLGADCSGFVYSVFKYNDLLLPRDADQQFLQGAAVNADDFKRGDLVFFRTYLPDVSHVGIYCGNGKFIHCSSYAGVIFSDMTSGYYKEEFCGARRILQ